MAVSRVDEAEDGDRVNSAGTANKNINTIQTAQPATVPVLIIGGGPTGLLQAYLLSKLRGMVWPNRF